jgi:hypothetical protein
MPVAMPNVLISTSRAKYDPTTGTSAPAPYLSGIEAHAGPISQRDYRVMPEAALTSDYLIEVEIGTDIVAEDVVPSMTPIDDPYTPWDELGTNEAFTVIFPQNSAAGPLQHRKLWCKRVTAGGPAQ